MSKRLQVLLSDKEMSEIRQSARRENMTTSEWVRHALRAGRRAKSGLGARRKLDIVRAAARYGFPAPDIEQMLDEIERGYRGEPTQ